MNSLYLILVLSSFAFAEIINIPDQYSTIQAGIDASMDGDTILVDQGNYYENLIINKSIVLASHAIYDNLDEWVIFDDLMFNQWVVNNSHIENTHLIGSNPDDPDYGSVILIVPDSEECISPEIVGFTIQGGNGTTVIREGELNPLTLVDDSYILGGGILADVSDPYIHHNAFKNNGSDDVFSGGASQMTSSAEDWSFDNRFENYNPRCDVEEFRLSNNLYDGNNAYYGNTMANRFHEDEFDMSGSIFDVFDCGNEESAVSTIWVKVEPAAIVDFHDGAGQVCSFIPSDVYVNGNIEQQCLDEGCGFENNPFKTLSQATEMINPTVDNPTTIHFWPYNQPYVQLIVFSAHPNDWDVSEVTSMENWFYNDINFNKALNDWDVSNVESMEGMFWGATSFNKDNGNWDVGMVHNMKNMFHGATSFNQDIGSWDLSAVTDMEAMFWGATSFNQPIEDWYFPQVHILDYIFHGATSFNQPIEGWDISSATRARAAFRGATSFNQPIENWEVSNLTDMEFMFNGATSFNQPIEDWDVSSVINVFGMFWGATSFNQPIEDWDVSAMDNLSLMFAGATSFNQPIEGWDISYATNLNSMFDGATSFNQPIRNLNMQNVESIRYMFKGATSFDPISSLLPQGGDSWEIPSVLNMQGIFNDIPLSDQEKCILHEYFIENWPDVWPYDWESHCEPEEQVLLGDTNFDENIDILDILSLINYIIGNSDFNDEQLVAADFNNDLVIDILDALTIVDFIMAQ